jgi:hypothetical protein
MNELILVERPDKWQMLKALVLDSVSSPITRRVYNMALDEFIVWYKQEPRPGFTKATVSAWRASLEARRILDPSEWEQIDRTRQIEAVQAIVERISYDGNARQISIRFHPAAADQEARA